MPISAALLEKYRSGCFVETGTWHGDAVAAALAAGFPRVRSVELSPQLHQAAAARFAGDSRVRLWLGLSEERLSEMLGDLTQPATLWLDAHFSGGDTACGPSRCPLLDELAAIARHPINRHFILIDDIRLFGSELPTSLEDAKRALRAINPEYSFVLEESGIPALGRDILVAAP